MPPAPLHLTVILGHLQYPRTCKFRHVSPLPYSVVSEEDFAQHLQSVHHLQVAFYPSINGYSLEAVKDQRAWCPFAHSNKASKASEFDPLDPVKKCATPKVMLEHIDRCAKEFNIRFKISGSLQEESFEDAAAALEPLNTLSTSSGSSQSGSVVAGDDLSAWIPISVVSDGVSSEGSLVPLYLNKPSLQPSYGFISPPPSVPLTELVQLAWKYMSGVEKQQWLLSYGVVNSNDLCALIQSRIPAAAGCIPVLPPPVPTRPSLSAESDIDPVSLAIDQLTIQQPEPSTAKKARKHTRFEEETPLASTGRTTRSRGKLGSV